MSLYINPSHIIFAAIKGNETTDDFAIEIYTDATFNQFIHHIDWNPTTRDLIEHENIIIGIVIYVKDPAFGRLYRNLFRI